LVRTIKTYSNGRPFIMRYSGASKLSALEFYVTARQIQLPGGMPVFLFIDRVGVLCCLSLIASFCYGSDLKITQRVITDVSSQTRTQYISGPRSRTESRDVRTFPLWNGGPLVPFWGHRVVTIYQCDARHLLELDLDSREYTSQEINEQGQPVSALPISLSNEPSGGTLTINVDDMATGENKIMFGYAARHIIRTEKHVPGPRAVSQAQEIKRDGWYVDFQPPEGCPKFKRSPPEAVSVATLFGGSNGVVKIDKIEVHHTGAKEGQFPLELTITSPGVPRAHSLFSFRSHTYKMEVTEFSTAPLDPALFALPEGFTQVTALRTEPPTPPSPGFQRVVAWVKQSVSERFR
jgi:hypothetical protein